MSASFASAKWSDKVAAAIKASAKEPRATPSREEEDDRRLQWGLPVLTKYESNDVDVPADFLAGPPPQPVTLTAIDWAASVLPEKAGMYAVVLDGVLSGAECDTLLRLAEASVPRRDGSSSASSSSSSSSSSWRPALVNIGGGLEVLNPSYRRSDRIIWDQQDVVDRLWARCLGAPGVAERLLVVGDDGGVLGAGHGSKGRRRQRWEFRRFNQRMRFLKYGPGQFFRRE